MVRDGEIGRNKKNSCGFFLWTSIQINKQTKEQIKYRGVILHVNILLSETDMCHEGVGGLVTNF